MQQSKLFLTALGTVTFISILACQGQPADAPATNQEIKQHVESASAKQDTTQQPAVEPTPTITKEDVSAKDAAAKALPTVDGFADLKFGASFDELRKSAILKKRCVSKALDIDLKKDSPSQKITEKTIFCDAKIVERFASMDLSFDHNKRLYKIQFKFDNGWNYRSKVKELYGDEADKFVSDLRAVLEPTLGEPSDNTVKGGIDDKVELVWDGVREAEDGKHDTSVTIQFSTGIIRRQEVVWLDSTMKSSLEKAKEDERTASIKEKGL